MFRFTVSPRTSATSTESRLGVPGALPPPHGAGLPAGIPRPLAAHVPHHAGVPFPHHPHPLKCIGLPTPPPSAGQYNYIHECLHIDKLYIISKYIEVYEESCTLVKRSL